MSLSPNSTLSRSALVAAFFVLLAAPAGADQRIVNGVETQTRVTTGALLDSFGAYFQHICSGTLIGCQTFLTAAHCVCPGDSFCTPNPASFAVYLQHVGVVGAAAVDVHVGYQFGVSNDVAVVTLDTAIDGIPPTPINASMDPPFGTSAEIAGYGITSGNNDDSGLLREGGVSIATCAVSADPVPEPAHVCWVFSSPVGDPGVDSNTCSGDSGGPLFADLGGGEVVIGITSGGDSTNCLPSDVSFDTNVFQNAAFIQGIGGADLLNTTCGTISQVDEVATEILALSTSRLEKPVRKCRKEVRKQAAKYTAAAIKARSDCFDRVGAGIDPGPCPDTDASDALAKAAAKVSAEKIGRKCPASIVAEIGAAGGCVGAADASDLATCILASGDGAVDAVLASAYADDAPGGVVAEAVCQDRIGLTAAKYQKTAQKVYFKCENGADKGKSDGCLDAKTTDKLAKAAAKVEPGIVSACDDLAVAALDSAGTFGGACGGSTTAAALAACLTADIDAEAETLVALLDSTQSARALEFTVSPGADRFRVTANGIDASGNDIDVYVRFGAPPTTAVYDDRSAAGGVFEGVEVLSPAAGQWHVLVDEFSGSNVDFQLTVTIFSP